MKNTWHRFVAGKDGKPVIFQQPNGPLIVWAIFELLSMLFQAKPWHMILSNISLFAILVWSFLEFIRGDSYFRRLLGIVVLGFIIAGRFW